MVDDVQMHTTAPTSRDFGRFKQQMLLEFGSIINKHGAMLALPTQVCWMHPLSGAARI